MKNRKILIMAFGGFVLALMIGVLLIYLRARPSCWTTGVKPILYDVTMIESDGSQGAAKSQLSGRLQFFMNVAPSIFRPNKPIRLQGLFKPLQFQSNGELYTQFRDFTHAFEVEIDSQCRVQTITFDGRETFSARRTLQRLVRLLALGREGEYTDFLGRSLMKPIELTDVTGESDDADRKVFTRAGIRVPSEPINLEEAVELSSIISSQFRFEGPRKALWHPFVSAEERLEVLSGRQHLKKLLNYSITLKAVDGPPLEATSFHQIDKAFRVSKGLTEEMKNKDRPSIYDAQPKVAKPALSAKEAIQSFRDQLKSDGTEAKVQLVAYLKSHPDAIEELQSMIEARAFSDEELIHILFVLAKVASPEAQQAMAELIGDEDLDKGTRLRALFAVAEVRVPASPLIAAVRKEYEPLVTDASKMDEMSSTALLNGGLLASHLRDIKPDEEGRIIHDIETIYQNARGSEIKATAIDAMGNSGQESFWDEIESSSRSPAEIERKAAYEAMARIAVPGREQALIKAVSTDREVPVRLSALQSLEIIGVKSPDSIQELKAALSREPDIKNRVTAVQILGQAIPFESEAKNVLLDQVAREQSPEVLQAAGRFVSAYDIAKARGK